MDTSYLTRGGFRVTRTVTPFDPGDLSQIAQRVDTRRGGVLSSGMEYPGRYSRWHIAYLDPPVQLTATGRQVTVRALNDRGRVLLPVLAAALRPWQDPAPPPPRPGTPQPRHPDDNSKRRDAASGTVSVPEPDRELPEEERTRRPSVFSVLRAIRDAFAPAGEQDEPHLGLYGAFGYDLGRQFEPLPARLPRDPGQRDLVLHLPDRIWVVDRRRDQAGCFSYEFAAGGADTTGLSRETGTSGPGVMTDELPEPPRPGSYAEIVRLAREKFFRGDLFEVTPSHVFAARCGSPARFYELLRERNPAPYEFLFNLGEGEFLVGASPEMYVRVTAGDGGGQRVETCPIAGTIARGEGPLEDAANIATLLGSEKEESELTMCTDVDRNDKARVCVPGSVQVIGRRQIEMYSRLIHTVDHIEGRLRPGMDALDAFVTHMWAVTVTGAPKAWAMRFIEEHEATPRRWYGGAVGVIGFNGSLNTGLTLRTAHIRNGVALVRAGATLLYDSVPEAEERETRIKARALMETLAVAAAGTTEPEAEPAVRGQGSARQGGRPGGDRSPRGNTVLLVDHQDSFVHTLGDYFRQRGAEVTTLRYGFAPELLDEYRPDLVVLSPGPGRPEDFGCAGLLDELYRRELPVFGVCLGLQAMVEHAGGKLSLLGEPVHGKPGRVQVRGGGLLTGLEPEFIAGRYHSLFAEPDAVPAPFQVTAVTGAPDGTQVTMAIEAPAARRWAVQFHPESIMTAAGRAGHQIITNILALATPARSGHQPARSGHQPARSGHQPARSGHQPAS